MDSTHSAHQNAAPRIDCASQTIEVEKKVSEKTRKDIFDELIAIVTKYQDSEDAGVEHIAKYLVDIFCGGDRNLVTKQIEDLLKDIWAKGGEEEEEEEAESSSLKADLDEKAEHLKEMALKENLALENIAELKRRLQNAEHQKKMKQKELEGLGKKYRYSENCVAHLTNVNKVLKEEKSKRSAEDAAYEKLKKDNKTMKDDMNRLEEILITETDTVKKLVFENEKLQEQVELKMEEVSELKKERNLMIQAFEKDGELSVDQQLLLKKLELSDLMEKFTDPLVRAEKETFFESLVSSPGVSKNAQKKAKKQLDNHFESNSAAVEIVQKNMDMIKKHFQFNVDCLVPIPDIPPAFNEEMKCLKSEKLDDYEEKCGVCSKPLRTSSNSGVVVSALSQSQCHFECATKDLQQ